MLDTYYPFKMTPLPGYWDADHDRPRTRNTRHSNAQCTNICISKSPSFSRRTLMLMLILALSSWLHTGGIQRDIATRSVILAPHRRDTTRHCYSLCHLGSTPEGYNATLLLALSSWLHTGGIQRDIATRSVILAPHRRDTTRHCYSLCHLGSTPEGYNATLLLALSSWLHTGGIQRDIATRSVILAPHRRDTTRHCYSLCHPGSTPEGYNATLLLALSSWLHTGGIQRDIATRSVILAPHRRDTTRHCYSLCHLGSTPEGYNATLLLALSSWLHTGGIQRDIATRSVILAPHRRDTTRHCYSLCHLGSTPEGYNATLLLALSSWLHTGGIQRDIATRSVILAPHRRDTTRHCYSLCHLGSTPEGYNATLLLALSSWLHTGGIQRDIATRSVILAPHRRDTTRHCYSLCHLGSTPEGYNATLLLALSSWLHTGGIQRDIATRSVILAPHRRDTTRHCYSLCHLGSTPEVYNATLLLALSSWLHTGGIQRDIATRSVILAPHRRYTTRHCYSLCHLGSTPEVYNATLLLALSSWLHTGGIQRDRLARNRQWRRYANG